MIITFSLVCWLQSTDKNFKKKSKFDKLKLPILTASIVGLLSQYICEKGVSNIKNIATNQEIFTEVPNF